MSIDINWDTLTGGPDGQELADKIRDFIDERFRNLPLPKLIRSVRAQAFDFGSTAPQITIKDICEPLADFYETDENEEGHDDSTPQADDNLENDKAAAGHLRSARERIKTSRASRELPTDNRERMNTSPIHGTTTPGFLHGPSNLGYFHLPLSAGLSGTNTPLAAVAGAHFTHGIPHTEQAAHHPSASFSSISPPPTMTPPSRPTSRDESVPMMQDSHAVDDMDDSISQRTPLVEPERSPEDLQIVFHVTYSGDVRLSMTAEVFLDYPMPSFVGIPLTINITGLTFDGVGIVAYIKRKAHVCFLAPEDAEALIGGEALDLNSPEDTPATTPAQEPSEIRRVGGLIEDIKIESEMGGLEGGKQVLKNVGKIEKFLLEQVQRVFEDEFVYPSFWTFLV